MSEEEIRNIARDTIGQQIRENVDSALIFKYVSDLENENKKLKENIEYWQNVCDKRQDKIFELLAELEGDK